MIAHRVSKPALLASPAKFREPEPLHRCRKNVKRHLALLVQVAGLAATGYVVWTAAVVPRLGRQPLAGVIWEALQHALLACFASAAITLGLYLLIARSGRTDALLAALRTSAVAVWFAPATLLLSELSPLALGAALVLVISTTRLLYLQWQAIHAGQPVDEFVQERKLFSPPPAPLRLKDLAPALIASLGLEAGIVAVLMGNPLLGAVLFSLATAMLTLASLAAGAYDPPGQRSLPRSILGLALTIILAAGFTVGGLADHIQRHGSGWHWGSPYHAGPVQSARALLERLLHGNESDRPKGSVTRVYAPPTSSGSVEINDKSFPGVVLFSEPRPRAKLMEPRPGWARNTISSVPMEPSIIPFSGEYWMFRPPDTEPPRKSYTRWGNPETQSFLTTDHATMTMQARQRLEHPIDLSCCGEIQIAISNADRYPGTVALELILIDNGAPQSLGTVAVPTRTEALLSFPIPGGSTIRQFDELEVMFHRDRVRIDRSARISIQRFVLMPR